MALIRNGSNQLTGLSRFDGAFGASSLRGQFDKGGRFKNFDSGEHAVSGVTNKASIPSGTRHPISWKMGTKAGDLSSRFDLVGSGGVTGTAALGKNAEASLSGSGTITSAQLDQIVSMLATLAGSGEISEADARAFLAMAATISGVGSLTGTTTAKAHMAALLEGEGVVDPTIYATGELESTIRGYGDLTPEGLRDAVWSALAASYNVPGTMGEQLNNAGTGGIDTGALADAIAAAILADPSLLTVGKFLGLNDG
jgi:hypothetical protein